MIWRHHFCYLIFWINEYGVFFFLCIFKILHFLQSNFCSSFCFPFSFNVKLQICSCERFWLTLADWLTGRERGAHGHKETVVGGQALGGAEEDLEEEEEEEEVDTATALVGYTGTRHRGTERYTCTRPPACQLLLCGSFCWNTCILVTYGYVCLWLKLYSRVSGPWR